LRTGLALAAVLALAPHELAGGLALFNADRAVPVGVDAGEQGEGATLGFVARDPAVMVRIGGTEGAAAEAGEHAAASAATALAAKGAALSTITTAEALAVFKLGLVEHAVMVEVEASKGLDTPAGTLAHPGAAAILAHAAALAASLSFILGYKAVPIDVHAGEAGIDASLEVGAGQRLGGTAGHDLSGGNGGGEREQRCTCECEGLHVVLPITGGTTFLMVWM
jgi:hypothetical protein